MDVVLCVCVKFYLTRYWFALATAKCLGESLFVDTVQYSVPEYVRMLRFFQISKKKHAFLRFFEMTCENKRKKSLAKI